MTPSHPIPSAALIELLSPDGYYTYLGIEKPKQHAPAAKKNSSEPEHAPLTSDDTAAAAVGAIDEDAVKKNYRKLSLKHHPDKPSGDADTFRVLNRAQRVLMNAKLRQQYDILGIDLDDDEAHEDHDGVEGEEASSTAQGIVHEIASMVLTSIIQLGVRTRTYMYTYPVVCVCVVCVLYRFCFIRRWVLTNAMHHLPLYITLHTVMMGAVAVLVVRFRWMLFPALAFLTFIAYQIYTRSRLPGGSYMDLLSPGLIAVGLVCMHVGRTVDGNWTLMFWLGEATVISMFTLNSASALPKTPIVLIGIATLSILAALWFRGNVWNYAIVIGLELFIGAFVAFAFPIMEMILESILNEKLQKVGDKVRAHHRTVQAYYEQKLKQ
jgi:hypothetical protein